MGRRYYHVRKTVLVVGEGDSEEVFLKHLREIYCVRGGGVTVTVRNAHGKGPENVIAYAARQAAMHAYDKCVALLDTDIFWTDKLKMFACKANIEMIGSVPCFEGLLLTILGKRVPARSAECKKAIQRLLSVDITDRPAYVRHFPVMVLNSARVNLPDLDRLIRYFEGHGLADL